MKSTLFVPVAVLALQILVLQTLSFPSTSIYRRQEVGACDDPESGCPGGNYTPPPAFVESALQEVVQQAATDGATPEEVEEQVLRMVRRLVRRQTRGGQQNGRNQQDPAKKNQQDAAKKNQQDAAKKNQQDAAKDQQDAAKKNQQDAAKKNQQDAAKKNQQDAAKKNQQDAAKKNQQDAAKKNQQDAAKKNQQDAAKKNQQDAAKKNQQDAAKKNQQDAAKKNQQDAAKKNQQDAAKQDAAKKDAAKQDAAKKDAAKKDAAKQDAAKQDAAKKDAKKGGQKGGAVNAQALFDTFCQNSGLGNAIGDGTQKKNPSCSKTIQGVLPSFERMVSTVIMSPANAANVPVGKAVKVQVKTNNLDLGFFEDPQTRYYLTPQTLNAQGIIEGHQHVSVQRLGGAGVDVINNAPDARTQSLAFFKGLEADSNNGVLNVEIPGQNLNQAGTYRICTITGTRGHQPVLMPVAQRGSQDDCIRINVQ